MAYQQQHHNGRHATPRTGSSRSTFPIAIVAGVIACALIVAIGILVVRPLLANRTQTQKPAAQAEQTVTEAAAEQPTEAEPHPNEQEAQYSSSVDPEQPAADPRDAEFAVDPTRTEWNFTPPEQKVVYLTFDDGPSENTQPVLDILDAYGIKATFFVTGINPSYAPMIKECYTRGHTIGLHTYCHEYDQVYASIEAFWADLGAIGEEVREQIGYVPCFIRFAGGSSNTVSADYTPGIMTALSQQVVEQGYQYFDWDASCGDGAVHTADELVEGTKWDTEYCGNSIVFLMHDGAGKATTVEALPRIIEYFQSLGYGFAAIDRSTCVPHHGIGN